MALFFLLVELFGYSVLFYALYKKKDLAIVYLPVLLFTQNIITPALPAYVYYVAVSGFMLFLIEKNLMFYRNNIFSIILIIYFAILSTKTSDYEMLRSALFPVMWLFFSIPLISSIYRKHYADSLIKELGAASFLILLIFSINVGVSTVAGYAPNAMYGITSGILYGNLYATDFNILAIAVFIMLIYIIKNKNLLYTVVLVVAFAFVMLSLRRSVMGISLLGIGVTFLILFFQKRYVKVFGFAGLAAIIGFIILINTNFITILIDRYEQRKLDERELEGEARFKEYELLYKDMFVFQDYSPWFGFELFNSSGNYGKKYFGDRTLHSDFTNITHSSGLIGLMLYVSMVIAAFRQAYRKANSRYYKLIIFFCAAAYFVFTVTGRYANINNPMLIMLLLMLPLAKRQEETKAEEVEKGIEFEIPAYYQ